MGARLDDERVIFFDKTRSDSTVHRRGRLDSVSVKLLDRDARPIGFGRFVGLFTHRAIRMRPSDIPILAARRTRIVASLGAEPGSHTHKIALEAYDCLPVEFLFPAEAADVARAIARIVAAAERRKLEVTTVADPTNRSFFVSVALPRQLYEERIREEIDRLLETRHAARHIDHRSSFLDDDLALVHFFCGSEAELELPRLAELDAEIAAIVERWEDRFEAALVADQPSDRALRLADAYADAFPESYRVTTSAAEAVLDVRHLERLHAGETQVELGLDFATEYGDARTHRLKIYLRERPYLTELLSVVHQFGVRVIDATSTEVRALARPSLWIVSFRIEPMAPGARAAGEVEARALDGLRAALSGRVDSDDLNRLILGADLDWRSVDVLRAYLEYARQIGQAPRGSAARDALVRQPEAARALLGLFRARFDPALGARREGELADASRVLAGAREPIASGAEDRVFAVLENLIQATLRTNFFVAAPPARPNELAFKLASARVRGLPLPAPWVEIFVHSCELVGVHLRGGPVARGGLRWSDRPQDVRSEVLGLWRTQMVKNGLIVPVGAKGGFALRRSPADPGAARAEADRLYARFVAALLRLSDDVKDGCAVAPAQVVRHDGDDPYLVVAADKGTAHLSDAANRAAAEHGFWLGDAFASGGSNGYDHKREAITARGAWLCVQRHFAELGRDAEREPFTVVGIGDMSGDVFGNGLLLMRSAKLVAAFDHRHVFLDPEPPEAALEERRRLFGLPRSSWGDYSRETLGPGGGVFERSAKRIPLSAEARRVLGTERGGALRRRSDPRDPARAGRPALERRDRHLREGRGRVARRGERPRQRRGAGRRPRRPRQGRGRGRQRRLHAARAGRVRARRRAHRHRRDRQRGRGRALGPRGELQDPAGAARRQRAVAGGGAKRGAARVRRARRTRRCSRTAPARAARSRSRCCARRRTPSASRWPPSSWSRAPSSTPSSSTCRRASTRARAAGRAPSSRFCSATPNACASRRSPRAESPRTRAWPSSSRATSRRCSATASRTSSRRTSCATRSPPPGS